MAVKFTTEQQKVITTRGKNILVSAAAGSGKTAVLVERIVRMVCDEQHPVDIDRLLVVTFTSAAAAEMKERLTAGINARMEENPHSEHIQRQAALIHNAQITTIDSFCLFILRNHFNEIGLDPAFRIADKGEVKLLEQDVLAELLEDKFASGEDRFRACVEYFCAGGKESALENAILKLTNYASSFPWPETWLEERKKDYVAQEGIPFNQTECGSYFVFYMKQMLQGCAMKLKKMKEISEEPDGPYMYGETVDAELDDFERLLCCETIEDFYEKIPAFTFGRLSGKKDSSVNADKREKAKKCHDDAKKFLDNIQKSYFKIPIELMKQQSDACIHPIETLIDLTLEFSGRLADKMRHNKMITFSDAEHFALNILLKQDGDRIIPSNVALEYRKHFVEVLIDEYQDSNLVQEYLLSAVSGEDDGNYNRFMVGDVKQSIYKFRLARPELFLEKYHTYQETGDRVRIDLSKNFRSRAQVIDTVNDVFGRIMSSVTSRIEYDAKAALYAGAAYPGNTGNETELLLIEKSKDDSQNSDKEAEALVVAHKIKKLKCGMLVTDKVSGELRPAKYSDMVILLRSNAGWDDVFKKVLEEEGIPVYAISQKGYFDALEVKELLQMLKTLDNPTQDIPLYGVMKSIFGGFCEEEIAQIRSDTPKGSLYDSLKIYAEQSQSVLGERVAAFLEMIKRYRELTVYLPIRELLTEIVTDFDYLNYVTALPAGGKRRANVEMLFTRASDFENTSYFGLFHFVRYIEQLQKYEEDYGEGELLDENADVVRLMSIHKSKGLEFPITFISGIGKQFNLKDVSSNPVLDMDLGIGIDYVDSKNRISSKTLRKRILSCKVKQDMLAEELRILYVAMTRAKEKLILTGTLKDAETVLENLTENDCDQLSFYNFMESKSYLDFLLPVLAAVSIHTSVISQDSVEAAQPAEQIELALRKEKLQQEAGKLCDQEACEILKRRLKAVYPYEKLAGLYTKTTVSELKIAAMADRDEAAYHTFEEKEIQPYIPSFRREEEKVSGTVRGNAYHRVMELLDFEIVFGWSEAEKQSARSNYEAYSKLMNSQQIADNLNAFLETAALGKRLQPEYREAVNTEKIIQFLQTEPAYQMWKAEGEGRLFREQPFVLGIPANRIREDFPSEEKVLIQGIIDVFWEEEDGIVLLDYKTDAVNSLKELWNRYETQLDYYGEALESLMGKPVKRKLLYSFRLGNYS